MWHSLCRHAAPACIDRSGTAISAKGISFDPRRRRGALITTDGWPQQGDASCLTVFAGAGEFGQARGARKSAPFLFQAIRAGRGLTDTITELNMDRRRIGGGSHLFGITRAAV